MQGGRDLLNQWTIVDGPHNHGTRAQARRGKLLIRVSWIVGMRPDEATVVGFSMDPGQPHAQQR